MPGVNACVVPHCFVGVVGGGYCVCVDGGRLELLWCSVKLYSKCTGSGLSIKNQVSKPRCFL